jgi:hypothetical protein
MWIQEARKHTDPTDPDPDTDWVRNTDLNIERLKELVPVYLFIPKRSVLNVK